VKSASRLDHTSYAGGTLLNIKFDPSLFADERGMNLFMSLVKAQCDLGVYELTPNVVSTEMLRDAQRNPDEYRGLIVRVAGYCAFFTELWSDVQEHIIERTVQKTWD
jgi:formate C-acetyltransferase